MTPGPVVDLNRAVAISEADGPEAGLAVIDVITGLEDYHLFHAARGHLLARTSRAAESAAAWRRAAALTHNPSEAAFVAARVADAAAREGSRRP